MRNAGAGLCVALLAAAGLVGNAHAEDRAASQEKVAKGAETFKLERQDVSPPLRDMRVIAPSWWDEEEGEGGLEVHRWPVKPLKNRLKVDPALQGRVSSSRVATTAGVSFDGVGTGNYSVASAPPDTVGAAGPTQYVSWVNTAFAVFNKSNGALVYGPAAGKSLWQGFGGRCETDNNGDPLVTYDRLANRWVLTQFAVSAAPYYQCIAVSTTSDATGSYRRFAYSFGSDMNDYPHMGVWPDAYYITFNMFTNAQTWKGGKACAFDRNQMISASGTPANMQCFQLSTTYGGLLPSDLDGTTLPPAGAPNYHLAFDDVNRAGLNMWKFHVDWTTPANSTFAGPTLIPTAAFNEYYCSNGTSATCVPQPGTTQKLDTLADRLMYRLAYRNFGTHEAMVVNHSVDAGGGKGGVRWYEVRNPGGSPTVYQQGTWAPDTNHRWMGTMAMDKDGNIALGYSVSGSVSPSMRYTGRLASDPLNTMQAETSVIAGASQGTGLSRWGDYASMTLDPTDDCTFWFTTEYLKTAGTFNWSTRVASFKFPSCGGTATPDFSVSAAPSALTLAPGGSGSSTVSVASTNGFNSAVALSVSGLPAGVSASFSSPSVTPPANGTATSTLTLTNTSAAAGTYALTVGGVNGSTTRTTSLSLTVQAAGQATYDGTLKAPKCAAVGSVCDSGASLLLGRGTLGPEPNQPNTINSSCADGTSGTYHSDESNDRLKVTSVDGSAFAPGKSVRVDATVWAYSSPSSDKLDLYYAANASSPSWVLIGTLQPTAAGAQTLSATYTLPTGTLQAVRARFRYNGTAAACATGSYDDFDDLVFAVGAGSGDTTAPTTSLTAPAAGATVSGASVVVSANASDNVGVSKVDFYYGSTLIGTDTTSPYSVTWNTTGLTNGSYSLTSKATDAAGNVGTSAAVSVTVNNGSVPVTVFSDGAESSTSTFVRAYANTSTQWVRLASAPYAGSYVWKAGSSTGGNYGNSGNATLTTPTLNLSGATTATLTYAFKHSTESGYDFFKVRISTNGGTSYTDLITATSGNSSGYSAWAPLKTISLNSYVGQTNVKIQFQLTTDGSVTGWGAAVDEVKVVKQ